MRFTNEEKTILVSIIVAAVAGLLISNIFSYNRKLAEAPVQSAPLLININTASARELDRLPGVGKIIAARIVEHRESGGGFKNTEELLKVKGITVKKLEAMKGFVCVRPESGIRNPDSKITARNQEH